MKNSHDKIATRTHKINILKLNWKKFKPQNFWYVFLFFRYIQLLQLLLWGGGDVDNVEP